MIRQGVDGKEQSSLGKIERLVASAIEQNASDIHLEPTIHGLRIRYRIDGMLQDIRTTPLDEMQQLIACIKVMARIDIGEKRIPQDGKWSLVSNGRHIDFRVATFPSLYGEKIVIRILDRNLHMISLERLGFSGDMSDRLHALLQASHGFLLVTGPTGAGKTTTLYAMLSQLHAPDRNIVTLENPIEYTIEGITQGQINPEAGFTFESGIRAVLRQDPDVLMVGEIRDRQTARIAIEAALTGHLVLSTLHTNDAPSAYTRLMDMGVEAYLINASLIGVLAQRLVRKICSSCKEEYVPTSAEIAWCESLEIDYKNLYRGAGCQICNETGYRGRQGVFELMGITQSLKDIASQTPHVNAIRQQALYDGMTTLMSDAREKLKKGVISLPEFMRVVIIQ